MHPLGDRLPVVIDESYTLASRDTAAARHDMLVVLASTDTDLDDPAGADELLGELAYDEAGGFDIRVPAGRAAAVADHSDFDVVPGAARHQSSTGADEDPDGALVHDPDRWQGLLTDALTMLGLESVDASPDWPEYQAGSPD
jgi:hypothetical protein